MAALFLALVILSPMGLGDGPAVWLLGLLLCAVGLTRSASPDLRVLLPFLLFQAVSLISTLLTFGNIAQGYASTHAVFLVVYLLAASLNGEELALLRRLCGLWTGAVAAAGLVHFSLQALSRGSVRLGWILGNPNALGIFLAVGWFALMTCPEDPSPGSRWWARLSGWAEPLILIALALTLSMGSFLALASGIAVLLWEKKRLTSWSGAVRYGCCLLARVVLGVGTGLLLYLAAGRTGIPWLCLPLLLYAAAAAACWGSYRRVLDRCGALAGAITALGIPAAAVAVLIRPSAAATFLERLQMMKNGLWYLSRYPLLGVGPYQWRGLNLLDADPYFNTYHIHNLFVHMGAELGVIAMLALLAAAVAALAKKKGPARRSGAAAFLVHNLMDTSFFYLAITTLTILTVTAPASAPPGAGTRRFARALFAVSAVFFLCCLGWYAMAVL